MPVPPLKHLSASRASGNVGKSADFSKKVSNHHRFEEDHERDATFATIVDSTECPKKESCGTDLSIVLPIIKIPSDKIHETSGNVGGPH